MAVTRPYLAIYSAVAPVALALSSGELLSRLHQLYMADSLY